MCVVAGLSIMAVAAHAFIFDGQITIDRALNSPTLTVRYVNANAALVELRVNGESVATRTVNAGKNNGETNFTLNLASLSGGENKIEIRLIDKSGKLLATESTTVTAENSQAPVFLSNPKVGSTLRGNVDIKVGFGHEMKNSYVSFFIDNQFKSISNVPPFEFSWDTSREANGWHEVEAWVVDESSTTFKTRKVKVFVQNPGGATTRQFNNTVATSVTKPTPAPAANPNTGGQTANLMHVGVSGAQSTKPAAIQASVATGPKEMIPTGTRNATKQPLALQVKSTGAGSAIRNSTSAVATSRMSVVRGTRLPSNGTFMIAFNTQIVDFDVQPRVENGVPLTPFRYLIEKAGGKVDWANTQKNVSAKADGHDIFLHIGDAFAQINKQRIELERPSFIDSGRTIVPLSFMRDALNVNIEYDKASNHVLITSVKK